MASAIPPPTSSSTSAAHPWVKRTSLRCRTKEPSFCLRFTPDDSVIVSGHYDGTIVGFDTGSLINKFEFNVTPKESRNRLPVTSVSFRPGGNKTVMLTTCSNGLVERYDWRTLERVTQFVEDDNELYCSDYSPDGTAFATAGRDATIRLYDDATCDVVRKLCIAPEFPTNTAALRIYSLRYSKQNPNILIAGGWGNAVHIYDVRTARDADTKVVPHHEIFGPYLCGDALDIVGDTILTASRRVENRVQVWNAETQKGVDLPWPVQSEFLPNCAKLSPDGEFIAVGGGGEQGYKDGAFVIEKRSGRAVVDAKFEKTVAACAFAHKEALVAFGDADGQIHLFENRFAHRK